MRLLRLSFLYWGRYKRFPHLLLYYMRTTVGGGISFSKWSRCRPNDNVVSLVSGFLFQRLFLRQNARQPISDISPDGGSWHRWPVSCFEIICCVEAVPYYPLRLLLFCSWFTTGGSWWHAEITRTRRFFSERKQLAAPRRNMLLLALNSDHRIQYFNNRFPFSTRCHFCPVWPVDTSPRHLLPGWLESIAL